MPVACQDGAGEILLFAFWVCLGRYHHSKRGREPLFQSLAQVEVPLVNGAAVRDHLEVRMLGGDGSYSLGGCCVVVFSLLLAVM